jgi:hypothetical protein
MRVLVACEESQRVCLAFRARGHEAYSCDLIAPSGGRPEFHLQMDCLQALHEHGPWDLLIAFPPCTHLAASGALYWPQTRADGRQAAAIALVRALHDAEAVARVAIENPVGVLSTAWRKPDQILQPYHFGHPYTKKTCLWLRGLPPLRPTEVVEPTHTWTCQNNYRCGPRKDGTRAPRRLPPRKPTDTAAERSKTFEGVARAMAEQWG